MRKFIGRFLFAVFCSAALLPVFNATAQSVTITPEFEDSEVVKNIQPASEGYDFELSLYAKSQSANYSAEITNDNEHNIKITDIIINIPEADFLEYSYDGIEIDDVIEGGESKNISITVRTNDSETTTTSEDFLLTILYDEIIPEDEEIGNVDTKDHAAVIFVVLGMAIAGGILLIRNVTARKFFAIVFAVALSAFALKNVVFAEEANQIIIKGKVNFTNIYTVTINPNGGVYDSKTEPTVFEVLDGTEITVGEATRETYDFVSWEVNPGTLDENNKITITSNTTIKALWNEIYYVLTIKPNGGSYNGSTKDYTESFRPGEVATILTPTQIGKNFTGWTKDETDGFSGESLIMNADTTLEANWEDQYFNVTINPNGGEFNNSTEIYTDRVIYGTEIDITNIARDNHRFKGWKKNNVDTLSPSTQSIRIIADTELEAIWNILYTVTVDPNGGIYNETTEPSESTIENGETFTVGEAAKDEYGLEGWKVDGGDLLEGNSFTVDHNTTLQAQWFLAVARIERTGKLYPSIMAAEAEANPGDITGDTITLLRDTTELITNEKEVTLDLNNHTVTGYLINTASGNITLINGAIDNYTSPVEDETNPNGAAVVNSGTLTMGINDTKTDGTVNIIRDNVRLYGTTYGLEQNNVFNFYDGFIEGGVGLKGGYNDSPLYRNTFDGVEVKYFPFVTPMEGDRQHVELDPADRAVTKTTEDGEIYYYNVQDNINTSAKTGYEIYAVRDFTASYPITVAENTTIDFDISGYNLTLSDDWTNNGTLNIEDSKTGTEAGNMAFARTITNNSAIKFTNAKASTTSDNALITNKAQLMLENSTLETANCYVLKVPQNGTTLTMDDNSWIKSTVNNSSCAAIKNDSTDLTISNGHVQASKSQAIENSGTVYVTGGEIHNTNGNNITYAIKGGTSQISGGTVKVTRTNGEEGRAISGTVYLSENGNIIANASWSNIIAISGTARISGGKIDMTLAGYGDATAVSGYRNGRFFEMTGGEIKINAKDNGYVYAASCGDWCTGMMSGGTIDVYSNSASATGLYIGPSYSSADIDVKGDAQVTVKTKTGRAIAVNSYTYTTKASISGNAKINALVDAGGTATDVYGVYTVVANISGNPTIHSDKIAVYYVNSDSIITGGTISGGKYGVDASGKNITIGNITDPDTISTTTPDITGGEYALNDGIYNFYDGILHGGTKAYKSITAIPDGAVLHVEEKSETNADEDAWLIEDEPFLRVNGVEYNSFSKAYAAASEGDTIYLITDKTTEGVIPNNTKTVTFDLNNYTLTTKQPLKNTGTLTIKDSGTEGKIINNSSSNAAVYNTGSLTIESGTYIATDIAINNNSGARNFTMTGGTVEVNSSYDACAIGFSSPSTISGDVIISATASGNAKAATLCNKNDDANLTIGGNVQLTATADNGNAMISNGTRNVTYNGGNYSATTNNGTAYVSYSYYWSGQTVKDGIFNIKSNNNNAYGFTSYANVTGGTINIIGKTNTIGFSGDPHVSGTADIAVTSTHGDARGAEGSNFEMKGGKLTVKTESENANNSAIGVKTSRATIEAGTIIADSYGIDVSSDATIGKDERPSNPLNISNPDITGGINAIKGGSYNFYGGVLRGGNTVAESLDRITAISDGAEYHFEEKTTEHKTQDLWLVEGDDFLEVNGSTYNSFTNAYNAAASGDTVKLIADKETTSDIPANPSGKTITLDLNNHSLRISKPVLNQGTMTITDLSNEKGGSIESTSNQPTVKNDGNGILTFAEGELINNNYESVVYNGGDTFNMTGGTIKSIHEDDVNKNVNAIHGSRKTNISGGTIIATNTTSGNSQYDRNCGIRDNTITFANATIISTNTNGRACGISAGGNLTVTSGTITVASTGSGEAEGIYADDAYVTVTGGEITVSAVNNHAYLARGNRNSSFSGGTMSVTSHNNEAMGIYMGETGGLTINFSGNASLSVTGKTKATAIGYYDGTWGKNNNFNMTGGEITVNSSEGTAYGVSLNKATITGGSIISSHYGVYGEGSAAKLTLGTNDGTISTTTPSIRGGINAVYNVDSYFYDGVLYGGEGAFSDSSIIKDIETESYIKSESETISDTDYDKRYLVANHDVARIGTTPYKSIAAAIEAASDGDIIVLTEDNYIYQGFTVPAEKNIVIDLDGNNIYASNSITNNGSLKIVNNGSAKPTIEYNESNVFIVSNENSTLELDGIKLTATKAISAASGSSVTVSGGEISQRSGKTGELIYVDGDITINNSAKISANDTAIHNNTGALSISDAEVSGDITAVYKNDGQTTISNSKLSSVSGYALYINKGTGATTDSTTEISGQIYNQNNTLTITGSSVKKNGGNSVALIENMSNASLSISGAEIEFTTTQVKDSSCYNTALGDNICRNSAITNRGTTTISGNTSIKLLTQNNNLDHNDIGVLNVGTLDITSGTVDVDGEGRKGNFYGIYTKGGNTTITSGHVDVKADKATGVYIDADGTFEMGTANPGHGRTDVADKTNPYIKAVGSANGISIDNNHQGRFNWYDGKLIGSHTSSNPLAPNLIEEYYEVKETTNGDGYKEANLDLMFENGS